MKTKLFLLLALCAMFFAAKTYSQEIEGRYSVGKTACTIEWNTNNKCYVIYWDAGTGYTLLFYEDTYPNGNVVWKEVESDGTTTTGWFTFKSDSYRSGQYERFSDGKQFNVRRK